MDNLTRELLTMSLGMALDDLPDILENYVQYWETLEIYCCVLHWK